MASRATAVGMNNDIYQIFPQPKDPDQTMRLASKGWSWTSQNTNRFNYLQKAAIQNGKGQRTKTNGRRPRILLWEFTPPLMIRNGMSEGARHRRGASCSVTWQMTARRGRRLSAVTRQWLRKNALSLHVRSLTRSIAVEFWADPISHIWPEDPSSGWLICSTRKPIKIVHARKKCQRNKSIGLTSNAPISSGFFNAHQGVLERSVWSHCGPNSLGPTIVCFPPPRCIVAPRARSSCWWVTKYFINVLSHFNRLLCPASSTALWFFRFFSFVLSCGTLFWSPVCMRCYLN